MKCVFSESAAWARRLSEEAMPHAHIKAPRGARAARGGAGLLGPAPLSLQAPRRRVCVFNESTAWARRLSGGGDAGAGKS